MRGDKKVGAQVNAAHVRLLNTMSNDRYNIADTHLYP